MIPTLRLSEILSTHRDVALSHSAERLLLAETETPYCSIGLAVTEIYVAPAHGAIAIKRRNNLAVKSLDTQYRRHIEALLV